MPKRPISVSWHFGEEADTDARGVPRVTAPPPSPGWFFRHWRRLLLAILLFLAVAAGLGYWQLQRLAVAEETGIRAGLQQAADLEAWAWKSGDEAILATVVDPTARVEWRRWYESANLGLLHWARDAAQQPIVEVTTFEPMLPDLAAARIRIRQAEVPGRPLLQELRFYRRTSDGWLRTSPVPGYWGAPKETLSVYFRFEHGLLDSHGVGRVAGQIDDIYLAMRRTMALAQLPDRERLHIIVIPENGMPANTRFVGRELVVSSPALQRAPEAYGPEQILADKILLPLAHVVLEDALQGRVLRGGWHLLYGGLANWLAYDANVFLRQSRIQELEPLRRHVAQQGLPTLGEMTQERNPNWSWEWGWMAIAGEALVDYAVTAHGRESLPKLLLAMATSESWDELIPVVFEIPADQFETGWQAHLAQFLK